MSKHTPSPWTQGTSREGKVCVWLDGKTEPHYEMGPQHTWIDCGTEANARLIAAAPDLLEALKVLADYLDERSGDNECRPLENARAAIAKATGEA